MTIATSKQKPRRSEPRVIDLTVGPSFLEELDAHRMTCPVGKVTRCPLCSLFWAAVSGKEFGRLMRAASLAGATRRDLATVAVELMAEDVT